MQDVEFEAHLLGLGDRKRVAPDGGQWCAKAKDRDCCPLGTLDIEVFGQAGQSSHRPNSFCLERSTVRPIIIPQNADFIQFPVI
jgi:hypothetical protein